MFPRFRRPSPAGTIADVHPRSPGYPSFLRSFVLPTAFLACFGNFLRAEPPAKPAPIKAARSKQGPLLIVGGGVIPETIRDRFLELGGGKKARVVVIPTASRLADVGIENIASYSYWAPLPKEEKVSTLSFLHTRRREEANDPKFVKPLLDASAVWFTGGDQELLTEAYKGTAVEREVRAVLNRGGVVGGTSAGAAVMSEIMIRSGNPVAEIGTGFGFVTCAVIDQHFHQRNRLPRLLGVLAKHPRLVGLGIDESTAIEVQSEKVTVMGKGNVRLCLPTPQAEKAAVKILAAGSEIDLAEYAPAKPPTQETSLKAD